MIVNPAVDQTVQTRIETPFKYPFKVTCVVPYVDELNRYPCFEIVKQFCQANRIAFSAREYNSTRYDEDCHYISRMPAFHFYGKSSELWGTYFTDTNIIQKIQDEIVCYKQQQERKRKRAEVWNSRVTRLVQFFEGLGKKKPKMVVPERPNAALAQVPIAFD